MKIFRWIVIALGASASFFAGSMDGGAKQLKESLGRFLILESQISLMQSLIADKKEAIACLAAISGVHGSEELSSERFSLAGMYARFALWKLDLFDENERIRAEAQRYYRLEQPK